MATRRTRRSGGAAVSPLKGNKEEGVEQDKNVEQSAVENEKSSDDTHGTEATESISAEVQQKLDEDKQPTEEDMQQEASLPEENDAKENVSDNTAVQEESAIEEVKEVADNETNGSGKEIKKESVEEVKETKGKKRPREKKESFRPEEPQIELQDIPAINEEEMRRKWKWSIRVFPISPDDAMYSGLSVMPKVQDSIVNFSRRDPDKGQMELCMQNTGDAMMMMVRVLRTPFTSRFITIELTKRAQRRLAKPSFSAGNTDSTGPGEQSQEPADDEDNDEKEKLEETKAEEEDNALEDDEIKPAEESKAKNKKGIDEKLEADPTLATKNMRGTPNHPKVWPDIREQALFIVDLMRVQKIRFMKKTKGELKRRSVFVGTMPKGTTEELLKVIFPMANGILMKNTDDSDCRKAFIETCHRFNAIGFMQSYPMLRVNGKDLKMNVDSSDLEALAQLEKEDIAEKHQEGDEHMEGSEAKEGDGESSEKGESKKKSEKYKKEEEERKRKQLANKSKKKRKRDFLDTMQREWNSATAHGGPGRQGEMRGPSMHASMARGGMGGLNSPERMRPVGHLMSAAPGLLGTAPVVPMVGQMEGKIAHLMRLQNQLEMTIQNQMSYIERAEAMRMFDQPVGVGGYGGSGSRDFSGGSEFGMGGVREYGGRMGGGGGSSSAGRHGGGSFGGGKGSGHLTNTSRDRQRSGGNRNKRAAESGGSRRGSGGGGGGSKSRFSSGGSPISSLVTSNPSKRFRRDSSGDRFGMRGKDNSRSSLSGGGGFSSSNFGGSSFSSGGRSFDRSQQSDLSKSSFTSGGFGMGSGSKQDGGKFGGSSSWGSGYGTANDLVSSSGFGSSGSMGGGGSYGGGSSYGSGGGTYGNGGGTYGSGGGSYGSGGNYGNSSLGGYGDSSFGSGGSAGGSNYGMDTFGGGRSWNTSYSQSQSGSGSSYSNTGGYGDVYHRY